MAEGQLKPRWGQPLTGIISLAAFTIIALALWRVFSDPRGLVGAFPYPFVMYLAMMILVGLYQHMFLGDWPFEKLSQPLRGIVETIVNLIVVWFIIHIVFYKIIGLGFNFVSQSNLEQMAAAGQLLNPKGEPISLDVMQAKHFAESAVVCFVLIGFYSYPFVTILFGKWPIRPSDLSQPRAGLAEIAWASVLTFFFYTVLIVPFWGWLYGSVLGTSFGMNTAPWWGNLVGFTHVHWVFGWWEWMIIVLFMTPNVWRMKPWSAIPFGQPWKGLISFIVNVLLGYAIAYTCTKIAPLWLGDVVHHIENESEVLRFLWYHAAEIAGFTLIPFLAWHHYFDDMSPVADLDSWAGFWFRTFGVLVLCALNYIFFYYADFGSWALGNPHWEHKFIDGESLVWNFWWIIPLLWNEWFFHKWPFYVHEH